ncbi:hypothetical protein CEXT_4241 [Caerostris extrusa]|uniref:Uncharacterized protein n=1 Tax=Caerostris extrusa TaxID=172846 RepID=A0AAV4N9S3_CAEEX|nr:hypothetical protein CEXT_4241 [Caerostris extrusa]
MIRGKDKTCPNRFISLVPVKNNAPSKLRRKSYQISSPMLPMPSLQASFLQVEQKMFSNAYNKDMAAMKIKTKECLRLQFKLISIKRTIEQSVYVVFV